MLVLFAILVIGTLIGQISIKGIKLGAAGVLFTAMVFGHLGYTIPQSIMELGLLLFVYAVGLQAGPRFFRTFQRHGIQYVVIALAIVGVGALLTVAVGKFLGLDYRLASGLYTGALTCTPALAAAIDAVERIAPGTSGTVSVGYGIAYPFSLISVVLLIQFLPRLARRNLRREEERWAQEKQVESPSLEARDISHHQSQLRRQADPGDQPAPHDPGQHLAHQARRPGVCRFAGNGAAAGRPGDGGRGGRRAGQDAAAAGR